MLVLHASWTPPRKLLVWAEDLERVHAAVGRRPATKAKAPRHPFAARAAQLRDVAEGLDAEATLLLPTADGRPVPSNGSPGATLEAWRVPVLASEGPEELLRLAAREEPELRYLLRVADLGREIAARGRVVPALEGNVARWEPAPDPQDTGRMAALEMSMPGAVRAASPEVPPRVIVEDLVAAGADSAARAGLVGHRLPRARAAGSALTRALASKDAIVHAPRTELAKLEQALHEWRRPGDASPLRTCFRLTSDPWRVELLLQATDDPSLLVEASEVWRTRSTLRLLKRAFEHPQERLLADLGRAVRVWPELGPALETARPTHVDLDPDAVYRFLVATAPLLEQAGFGVLVPAWRTARLRARVKATTPQEPAESSGLLGVDGLCAYRYDIALGSESLSETELRELARLKSPLVRVRGEWVLLDPSQAERAAALLGREVREATVGELLRELGGEVEGIPIDDVEADGWLGRLLDAGDHRAVPTETPDGFDGTLRPYQERGLGWLAFLDALGLGGILADDMGLGKTPQMLALLVHAGGGPTLVVCPMSVVGNWQREAERFTPKLKVHVHHGFGRHAGLDPDADLVITTYGLLVRDRAVLEDISWARVVLDEAQQIKNPASKAAQVARRLRTKRRFALTGTPVENRLSELWSILEFCNAGLLGSRESFRERFATPIERYGDDDAAALLRRIVSPFVMRRVKTDPAIVPELPAKEEMRVWCNLTREQATLYQAVVDEMLERIGEAEGMARRGLVLATMTKLKQICNHPAHMLGDHSALPGRSGKLERTAELLESFASVGDRALVFTQYAEMGRLLVRAVRERLGAEPSFLYGGVPKAKRDEMVARFQDGDVPVMVLSIKAGGVGLNLTAATQVVHFDRWWNPAVEDQATDRAYRIGQRRNVQVRKLVCVGTLEERIDALIASKRELAQRIVGTAEGWVTELSTSELRELVALGRDAVAEA